MFKKILEDNNYYTIKDLKYSNKLTTNLNSSEVIDFIKYKEQNGIKLNLKTFQNESTYYIEHISLKERIKEFSNYNKKYFKKNNQSLIETKFSDIMISQILSEIEGTLLIENIPTTRKQIQEAINSKEHVTEVDIIIRNMDKAIKYILDKPTFNKENLHYLYKLLSKDCLTEDIKLKDNNYYRYDMVYIDSYNGCTTELIEDCMNSLFEYININLTNNSNIKYLLPHIAHYYILYIHPYFDLNGRCARLVSLWISILSNAFDHPLYISEAINDNKNEYYQSLINTRDNKNDLTYFFNYIFDISNKYILLYENIEYIEEYLINNTITLSLLEKTYLKRMLSVIKTKYFNQKIFIEKINIDITKQGALKILNKFEEYNILKSLFNNKNQKIFYFNNELIKYKLN